MSSLLEYMFPDSSVEARTEEMRSVERRLLSLARRYGKARKDGCSGEKKDVANGEKCKRNNNNTDDDDGDDVMLEPFDTRIRRSAVPLRGDIDDPVVNQQCSLFSSVQACGFGTNAAAVHAIEDDRNKTHNQNEHQQITASEHDGKQDAPGNCRHEEDGAHEEEGGGNDHDEQYLIIHGIRATSKKRSQQRQTQNKHSFSNSCPPSHSPSPPPSPTPSSASSSSSPSPSSQSPLVLLHGYANGSMYFYRNLQGLVRHYYDTVFSLDLLGWGLSSRPPFLLRDNSIETTEGFYVESLEAWRKQNNISKFILAGHSMGGYLSVAYAERYPHRIDKLLLLSPIGVPHKEDEFKADGGSHVPMGYRVLLNVVEQFYENGTTPSSFVRSLPESQGRALVANYVENRLPTVAKCREERQALTDYLYANAALPGSGELSYNRLFSLLAYAKKPLIYRIPKLAVRDIAIIYGKSDWMDPPTGLEVQRLCRKIRTNPHQQQQHVDDRYDNNNVKQGRGNDVVNNNNNNNHDSNDDAPHVIVYGVKDAGHLLMMDNWEEFNSAVIIAGGGETYLPTGAPRPRIFHEDLDLDDEVNGPLGFFSREKWGRNRFSSARAQQGGSTNGGGGQKHAQTDSQKLAELTKENLALDSQQSER